MAEEKESMEDVGEKKKAGKSVIKWILLAMFVVFFGIGGYVGWALSVKNGEKHHLSTRLLYRESYGQGRYGEKIPQSDNETGSRQ